MQNLIYPTNKSWQFFKNSWKPCVFGGINYLLKHPIRGPVALYHRLKFPILKRSITEPFTTPEGIEVESNQALIT